VAYPLGSNCFAKANPMMLKNTNGNQLAITIAGYEFPAIKDDKFGANWLLIDTEAAIGGRLWCARYPCLLTWEVAGLADWFEAIGEGVEWSAGLGFTEPNLHFTIGRDNGATRLQTYFELENRPLWAPRRGIRRDLWVELLVTQHDLRSAASGLRENLAKYPYRGAGACPAYPINRPRSDRAVP
jgi:hypothetical protein